MNEYCTPTIEIETFLTEDILTASFGDNDLADPWA